MTHAAEQRNTFQDSAMITNGVEGYCKCRYNEKSVLLPPLLLPGLNAGAAGLSHLLAFVVFLQGQ